MNNTLVDRDEAPVRPKITDEVRERLRAQTSKSQKAMMIAVYDLAKPPDSLDLEGDSAVSIRDAAELYDVNHVTVYKAFWILSKSRELTEAVLRGELTVGKAEAQLKATSSKPGSDTEGIPLSTEVAGVAQRIADLVMTKEGESVLAEVNHLLHQALHKLERGDPSNSDFMDDDERTLWKPEQVEYFKKLLNRRDGRYLRKQLKSTKRKADSIQQYNHIALSWAMNNKFKTLRFDEDATRRKLNRMRTQERVERLRSAEVE